MVDNHNRTRIVPPAVTAAAEFPNSEKAYDPAKDVIIPSMDGMGTTTIHSDNSVDFTDSTGGVMQMSASGQATYTPNSIFSDIGKAVKTALGIPPAIAVSHVREGRSDHEASYEQPAKKNVAPHLHKAAKPTTHDNGRDPVGSPNADELNKDEQAILDPNNRAGTGRISGSPENLNALGNLIERHTEIDARYAGDLTEWSMNQRAGHSHAGMKSQQAAIVATSGDPANVTVSQVPGATEAGAKKTNPNGSFGARSKQLLVATGPNPFDGHG